MSDKTRWDEKYAAGEYSQRPHPSSFLEEHISALEGSIGRRAADLACGRGRNSWYLASRGFTVDAYDVSPVGLSLASQADYGYEQVSGDIRWHERDLLVDGIPTEERYDLIVMIRFVALELLSNLDQILTPGGVVLVEEHLVHQGPESIVGPKSEGFRVPAGALHSALHQLKIVHSFEGLVVDPDGEQAAVARIIAQHV